MENKININKVVEFLSDINVVDYYNWEIPFNDGHGNVIFSDEDKRILNEDNTSEKTSSSRFDRNIELKRIICEKIKKSDEETKKKIYEWLVHDWGGIRGGRENIDKLYGLAENAINKETLPFDRIASVSKILSFSNPERFVIYDSRVAFSLNAILLLKGASNLFFPVPVSRNTKLNAFDIEVLIRMKNIGQYNRAEKTKFISNADKKIFVSKENAYSELNKTIIEINKRLYPSESDKQNKPYYTEMLLFGIADTLIYDEIIKRVKIEINL